MDDVMPRGFDVDSFRRSVLDDPLVRNVWENKYRWKDAPGGPEKSIAESQERVVAAVYANDPDKAAAHEALRMVREGYFLPAGRINAGAGTGRNVTLLNCYVNETVTDSMQGIQRAISRASFTLQQGGGIGTDFSTVRPSGAIVSRTGSVSSGPIVFMDEISAMSETVCSAGERRGAMMITLRDDHPDLWHEDQFETITDYNGTEKLKNPSFISVKRQRGRLTQANISVLVSDAFMRAVDADDDWDLGAFTPRADGNHVDVLARLFPYDHRETDNDFVESPDVTVRKGEMRPWYVYVRVKARRIWDDIMRSTYRYAEPGVIFIDRVNDRNNLRYCEDVSCTNPCQPSFAPVLTPDGITSFGSVEVGDKMWSQDGWVTIVNKWSTGVKPVYRYRTTAGVFYGTDEHRIVENGEKVPVKEAEFIDRLTGPTVANMRWNPAIVMDGLVIGDGSTHPSSTDQVYLIIGQDDGDYFTSEIAHLIKGEHAVKYGMAYKIDTSIKMDELPQIPTRIIPNRYVFAGYETIASFLRGLYSANGSVVTAGNTFRITLKTTSYALVEQVQVMLSSLGIPSFYTTNKAKSVTWSNGIYVSKESYDVNVAGRHGTAFMESIGFIQTYKKDKLALAIAMTKTARRTKETYEIRDVQLLGEFDVYDIQVSGDNHTYWTGGCNVSNCGEQPLPPHGCCCLGSVNVAFMVENPFRLDAMFSYDLFGQVVRAAVRFLDNVLDVSGYPLESQRVESMQKRRIGLGLTGVADMFVQMGYRYGDTHSLAMMRTMTRVLRRESYIASCALAARRGAFPLFNMDRFVESANVDRDDPDLMDELQTHGIRNGVLNTVAPNGTISIYSGNTAQGIEPVFSFDKVVRKVRQPDGTLAPYKSVNYSYRLYEAMFGPTPREALPDCFVGALEMDAREHVVMQAACQEYIDASISKTVNCPEDMTFESFSEVYRLAYESGCKGCTTYRPDPTSGRGSVLSVEAPGHTDLMISPEAIDEATRNIVLPRVRVMAGHTYKLKWPQTGDNWYVTVNGDETGRPAEVFIAGSGEKYAECTEWVQAMARLLTAVLRRGDDARFLVGELTAIHAANGGAFIPEQERFRASIVAAIGGVLEEDFRTRGLFGMPSRTERTA